MRNSVTKLLSAVLACLTPSAALAQEQFVLIDETFTATVDNTEKSQFPVTPKAGQPENWTSPVDYSRGSIHVRFEIMDKPSTRTTLCNVCFENSDTLTCMPYPPPYTTAPVTFSSAPRMTSFWQHDVYDWTKKVDRVHVVLKDENELIVQGNAQFYPSKMRITVTVVPPGKTYVEGVDMPPSAGAAGRPAATNGAGGSQPRPAGSSGAAGRSAAGGGSAAPPTGGSRATAGTGSVTQPASPAPSPAAGRGGSQPTAAAASGALTPSTAAGSGASALAGRGQIERYIDPGSNCSVQGLSGTRRAHGVALVAWAACLLLAVRRGLGRRSRR